MSIAHAPGYAPRTRLSPTPITFVVVSGGVAAAAAAASTWEFDIWGLEVAAAAAAAAAAAVAFDSRGATAAVATVVTAVASTQGITVIVSDAPSGRGTRT